MNLYCPTKDNHKAQSKFLKAVANLIEDYGIKNLIIWGDLNTYLDVTKDKKGGNTEQISKYAENLNSPIYGEFETRKREVILAEKIVKTDSYIQD